MTSAFHRLVSLCSLFFMEHILGKLDVMVKLLIIKDDLESE